jgi:Uma2 family endonuclease
MIYGKDHLMSEARAPQLITADDLFHMPDHDHRYELIEGQMVKMPLNGGAHGVIESEIGYAIGAFVKTHPLGTVLIGEVGFVLHRNPDTVLAPDVAFILAGREPAKGTPEWDKFWELAPRSSSRSGFS